MTADRKQARLEKVRMVARILGGSEHGHLHRTDKCCGRCLEWQGSDHCWYGLCKKHNLPECPKVVIGYDRSVCRYFRLNEAAPQCWEIIPEAHR